MELFQKANSQVEVATLPRPPDLSFFLGFRDLWDPIFPLPTPILFFQVISPQISNLETFWTLDCGFGIPDCWLGWTKTKTRGRNGTSSSSQLNRRYMAVK